MLNQMILQNQSVADAIDEIAELENLNDNGNGNGDYIFYQNNNNSNEGINEKDLMRQWESKDFKLLIQSYINVKYNKKNVDIPNSFAKKVYTKAYHQNIKTSPRFDLPLRILYHPDITQNDFHFVNQKIVRGQKMELYGSLVAVFLPATILYTTKLGKSIKQNPKQFYLFMGLPPIISIFFARIFSSYYLNYKLNKIGLVSKYGMTDIQTQFI